jgi:hypothetical protein
VQSGIDGTINEISALSSGLLLAGLGALSFIKLIHFSGVLFIIIALWIFVAFRLYAEYRRTIRKSLEVVGSETSGNDRGEKFELLSNRTSGKAILLDNYFNLVNGDLSILEKSRNRWLIRDLTDEAERRQDLSILPALRKIANDRGIEEELRYRAVEVIDQMEETKGDPGKLKNALNYVHEEEKIIKARKTLASSRLPQTTEVLRLLRDNNPESKRLAIYMIGKFRMPDMIPEVCDCLGIQGLEKDSIAVLASFGKLAQDSLFRMFLSSSGNIVVSKAIMRLIGQMGGKENTDFLFARLWSNSRWIRELAADELVACSYKADEAGKDKLNQLVSEIIGMLAWNISARASLEKSGHNLLSEVIKKETASWNSFLFNVLSVAYEKSSVEKIRANIESGTVASVNYALEMIDIVIDESIKAKLISLIDVVPDEEKLKNLHQFYPGEVPPFERLIEDILNRDYNLISIWAKACALRTLTSIPSSNLEESVLALLFSPEKILREEAALLVGRTGSGLFGNVSSRLGKKQSEDAVRIISGNFAKEELLFEKTVFLSGMFSGIPEDELLFLAESLRFAGEIEKTEGDCIVWSRESEADTFTTLIYYQGQEEGIYKILGKEVSVRYILPLTKTNEFRSIFPERAFGIYQHIDKFETNPEVMRSSI